jgi:hypothetical protein
MSKIKKTNKDPIIVYWSNANGFDMQDYASLFSEKPIPILKTLPEKDAEFANNNFGYRSCRGMLNLFKNTYVINNPVTSTVKVLNTDKQVPDYDDGGNNYWMPKERPIKGSLRMDLDFGYIFFSEEELIMRQVPPYMHKVKASETAWISAGSYDISKWFRPIFPSYILWEGYDQISVIKDEPQMYVQFETNRRIIFKRFEFTNDLYLVVNELMGLRDRNSIASLEFLYDVFIKSYRNKKVLKLIKENILE